jgi:hypothetical protein
MPSPSADRPPDERDAVTSAIDIERLADRVYRLMLAEARLEQARSGGDRAPKGP